MRDDVEPLDPVLGSPYDVTDPGFVKLVRPLLDNKIVSCIAMT